MSGGRISTHKATRLIQSWIDRVVIGEHLCPFAQPSIDRNALDIQVSEASNLDDAYRDALHYLSTMLDPPSSFIESGLLVFSGALKDFEEYLDCLEACEEAIGQLNLNGVLQLASFHPDYRFDGSDSDDQANWTNRSPLPAIHFLREEVVSEALSSVSHPEKIPERNIEHLRRLPPEYLRSLFPEHFTNPSP